MAIIIPITRGERPEPCRVATNDATPEHNYPILEALGGGAPSGDRTTPRFVGGVPLDFLSVAPQTFGY